MAYSDQAARAARFLDLNLAGRLLLPNAWDAASARIFEDIGSVAIGTTSGGIANARGLPDGEQMGRTGMVHEIKAIVDAVRVPVTADIESGYGDVPADVAETVAAVLDLGVVGINLEDRVHHAGTPRLYRVDEQVARIEAARNSAERRHIHLVINARTDTFLLAAGDDLEERITLTIERGKAYLRGGADLVFVPGLTNLDTVRRLCDSIGGPLSLMALPGGPTADAAFAAGARRVSLGNIAMLATLGALEALARDVLRTGTWTSIERTFYGFGKAEALFARRPNGSGSPRDAAAG